MKLTTSHQFILQICMLVSGFFAYTVGRSYLSLTPMLLLAFPAYFGLLKQNWKKGLLFIGILSIYATTIEAISILTGFPYGYFTYGDVLGSKLFDIVPWAVSFGWVPLVIGAVVSCKQYTSDSWRLLIASSGLLILTDLVLDPGAVALGFWTWITTSSYYTIPLSNYFGWLFSSLIGVGIFLAMYTKKELKQLPSWSNLTLVLGACFWTSVTFFAQMYIATLFGLLLLYILNKELFSTLKYRVKTLQNQ